MCWLLNNHKRRDCAKFWFGVTVFSASRPWCSSREIKVFTDALWISTQGCQPFVARSQLCLGAVTPLVLWTCLCRWESLHWSVVFVFRLSPCHGALGHSQSLLVASCTKGEIHLRSLQPSCCPQHWIHYLSCSLQGWQGISASQPLPKALQEVQSCRGDRGSARCICCPACVILGCRDLWSQREEGSLLRPSTAAHPHRPRTQRLYPYHALPLCNHRWCSADFSCKRLRNRDREVVVNTSLEITCCQ